MLTPSAKSIGMRSSVVDEIGDIEPIEQVSANIVIFMPTVIIGLLYGGIWVAFWLAGQGDSIVGRLAFALMILAPPLLLASAFLRFQSAGLAVTNEDVLIAQGWPHQTGIEVAINSVSHVEMRRSRLAGLFGAGDVRIRLKDDTLIKIPDLDRPERVVRHISKRIGQDA